MSHLTQEAYIPPAPSCCSGEADLENVCLCDKSDSDVEFNILFHEFQTLCGLVMSSVTAENFWQDGREVTGISVDHTCLLPRPQGHPRVRPSGKMCKNLAHFAACTRGIRVISGA